MHALARTAMVLVMLAGTAGSHAQSFNVDINSQSGHGAGAPGAQYGGLAGRPGHWNVVSASSPATLQLAGLDGQPTAATLTRALNGTITTQHDPQTTGSFEQVTDDFQRIENGTMSFTFSNLQAGAYALYTYGALPGGPSNISLTGVLGATGTTTQHVGGGFDGNRSLPGTTHALHVKAVPAGGSFTVTISGDPWYGVGVVSGLQLVRLDGPRLRMHVNDNAAGADTGGSWADSFTGLRQALAAAALAGGAQCEIWVAQGIYKPTAGADRTAAFVVPSGLRLYGGFAGTETSLAERTAPWFFFSILSGAIGASAPNDNSYNVVIADGTDSATVIDGFTIARGYANGPGARGRAGGISMTDSAATVRNCKLIDNYAAADGGAVHSTGGAATFANCLFLSNESGNAAGGAIARAGAGTLRLVNCSFLGNTAMGDGGAVTSSSPASVAGSLFSGNRSASSLSRGGAWYATGEAADVSIANCTFSRNFCAGEGGGVCVATGADAIVNNSILWGNNDTTDATTLQKQIRAMMHQNSTVVHEWTTVEGESGLSGADPMFVDADGADDEPGTLDDNCRPAAGSPCIDAGNNARGPLDWADMDRDGDTQEVLPLDLDGAARRRDIAAAPDTGAGGAPLIDRGAYEAQPALCPADFDGNGVLTLNDFVQFRNAYVASDLAADFDNSGTLTLADFVAFRNAYVAGCP